LIDIFIINQSQKKIKMKVSEFRKLIREEVKKVLREAKTLQSGQTIDDWNLVDSEYISEDDSEDWLDLLSDVPDGWISKPASKTKVLKLANTWLKKNGYTWQVADALSQNDEGEVTWKIQ
jgi:hypothetical protein